MQGEGDETFHLSGVILRSALVHAFEGAVLDKHRSCRQRPLKPDRMSKWIGFYPDDDSI
jgi:hypothetical protein